MDQEFTNSVTFELANILTYWKENSIDHEHGGFLGRIDHYNDVVEKSPKGIILNARILWTFSAASNSDNREDYTAECKRAYDYLSTFFKDSYYGGVYWEVNYLGRPSKTRKQTYAQAFTIYSLAEYYKFCKKDEVLTWALELFELIEKKAFDYNKEGYIEAFDIDWSAIDDMRLSTKDLNAPKTMNTHLHILEAYTTLFEVSGNKDVEKALGRLIEVFLIKFASENNHFKLFFSKDWESLSNEASFGHDIEAAWLLVRASEVLNDSICIAKTEELAVLIADSFLIEALDDDYGVYDSINVKTGMLNPDKCWWPQAEAVVGLLYVSQITSKEKYSLAAKNIWNFILHYIIDKQHGEWYFRVSKKRIPYSSENKVGPWKCPYHNSRSCLEILTMAGINSRKALIIE